MVNSAAQYVTEYKESEKEEQSQSFFKDAKWRTKNSLWTLLSFVPFFNFLAYLYAGFKIKKSTYTAISILLAAANFLTLIFALETSNYDNDENKSNILLPLIYVFTNSKTLNFMLIILAIALVSGITAVGMRVKYLTTLEKILIRNKEIKYKCLSSKLWKIVNSWWVIVALIPHFGALVLPVVTYRQKKYKSLAFTMVIAIAIQVLLIYTNFTENDYDKSCFPNILLSFVYIVQVFYAVILRKEYLLSFARQYEGLISKYSFVSKLSWRVKNSFWMVLSGLSYFGGISVLISGVLAKQRKWIIAGGVLLTLSIIGMIILINEQSLNYVCYDDSYYFRASINATNTLSESINMFLYDSLGRKGVNNYSLSILFGSFFKYEENHLFLEILVRITFCLSVIFTVSTRWEFMERRIDRLGGYSSTVEKQIKVK